MEEGTTKDLTTKPHTQTEPVNPEAMLSEGEAPSQKFRGISNVLFTEDILGSRSVLIDISKEQEVFEGEIFDVDKFKSIAPFKPSVRIAEFNDPSPELYHLNFYSRSEVELYFLQLEKLLAKYRNYSLKNKNSGLIWKDKVKRIWKVGVQESPRETQEAKRKERLLNLLLESDNLSLSKAAKMTGFSYNKAWRILHENFKPSTSRRTSLGSCLSITNIQGHVVQRYLNNDYISKDWRELTNSMKMAFPILQSFKDKTIQNELRKRTSLRAISIKRKPAKADTRALLQRQLLVGNVILNHIDQKQPLFFFDETIISEKNFKKTAIGTTVMVPFVPNYTISKLHIIVLFSLQGQVALQISSEPNTSATITDFFRRAIPRLLDRKLAKKITVVLDNAAVQKTSEFKALVKTLPINLLYNIPCSPYLNLIEDFFMQIKTGFKAHFHQKAENCVFSCLQAVKDQLKANDFKWMIRKLVAQIDKRVLVHKMDDRPFRGLTDFLKKREPPDLTRPAATNRQGIAPWVEGEEGGTKKLKIV